MNRLQFSGRLTGKQVNNLGSGSTKNTLAFLAQEYTLKQEAHLFCIDKYQKTEKVHTRYTVISGHKEQMTKKRRQTMYLQCDLKPANTLHMACITWLIPSNNFQLHLPFKASHVSSRQTESIRITHG